MSPTVFRDGPYRGYFFSHEATEPPHVHVDRDDCSAKFWLNPVRLAANLGFNAKELRAIEAMVVKEQTHCEEAWHAFFGS